MLGLRSSAVMILPEDGTLVPKRVAGLSLHEVCYVISVLLYCTQLVDIVDARKYKV
jgi:hypothetical protein